MFVARLVDGRADDDGAPLIYVRVETWLHRDQLKEQEAARIIKEGPPGKRLGNGVLLPIPLRLFEVADDGTSTWSLGDRGCRNQ